MIFFSRGHYTRPPTITKKDVAVREPGTVSQFGQLGLSVNHHVHWNRVCPLYLTVTHKIDRLIGLNVVVPSAVKKWMLSETMARQRAGCHWIRRYRRTIAVRCGRRSGRRGSLRGWEVCIPTKITTESASILRAAFENDSCISESPPKNSAKPTIGVVLPINLRRAGTSCKRAGSGVKLRWRRSSTPLHRA